MSPRQALAYLALVFAATLLLHSGLLRLPYFWDEAGYYIPAARDFFLHGQLIPTSTLTNAHPPLPAVYLAVAWKLFGYSPLVTRTAMLLAAAVALLAVFAISCKLQNSTVAWGTVACTALYPIWFAQSSMAHADLLAACFVLWGLWSYFERRFALAAVLFSLAALSKESAILWPVVLLAYELATNRSRTAAWLLAPVLPLATWFGYHRWKTGYGFGNPGFVRYNVSLAHEPVRVAIALLHRLWHLFGHMNLFVLTGLSVVSMFAVAQRGRHRIEIRYQLVIGLLVAANWLAFSFVGGALLTRYLLPCYPLIILIFVSTLWRRWRLWPVAVAAVLIAFEFALVRGPAYRYAPEDNLAYADYVRLHQAAVAFVEQHLPHSEVLSAWPGTDELAKPWLGYTATAVPTVAIEDFSPDQILVAAQEATRYDAAFVFSTKYDPGPGPLAHLQFWRRSDEKYFGFHDDLSPEAIAKLLGGNIVWQQRRGPLWAAVIVFPRAMVG